MAQVVSQCGQRYQFDAIVIGSGIAGLSYCLELLARHADLKLALVVKSKLEQSNTYYAQGGVAAALSPQDLQQHIQDTLVAGDGLCEPQVVSAILQQGSASIQYLLEQGVNWDRDPQNQLMQGLEAGHSARRIYHVGDHTGAAIVEALVTQVKKHSQITIFEQHTVVNLITQIAHHRPGAQPEVVGAYVLDESSSLVHIFLAKVLVLATGGAGKVYRYTSNSSIATGDGVAMAYRAGARVGGLEFYQFHPTLLYNSKLNNFLLSEALRGEGAYLRLPGSGQRFMQNYAPKELEMATRDVVARAICNEIELSSYDYVYLDIRHREREFLQARFPMIFQTLGQVGLDLSSDLIPIVPAAHYMGGGVLADVHGRTDLGRLLAIGETAYTGLHGANRLASNSLLEGIVMGRNAAAASASYLNSPLELQAKLADWNSPAVLDLRRASQINGHWRGLRGEMSAYAGIIRTEAGLKDLLKLILVRKEMIEENYWHHIITRDLIELRNIILVAELIVRCALRRCESRGGHYREDHCHKQTENYETIFRREAFAGY